MSHFSTPHYGMSITGDQTLNANREHQIAGPNVSKTQATRQVILPSWIPPVALLCSFTVLVFRMFRLVDRYAVNILFSDQWDFDNATLFQKHSLWEIFAWQHGPPRLGLGPLLQKFLEPTFRWNSRIESFLVGAIIVIGAGCAIYLKKRLFGNLSLFDVTIPLIFFAYVPYASLFITADIAHGPLPLVLLVLYGLAWMCSAPHLKYPLVLLVNFITIFTGFGLFIGVITPVLLIADYLARPSSVPGKKAYFIVSLLVSSASLGSFFIGYKMQPAVDCFSFRLQSPLKYFWFVELMYASVVGAKGNSVISNLAGAVVLIVLILCLMFSARGLLRADVIEWTQNAIAFSLLSFSLLFAFNTAYGRLCTGWQTAQSPRYANYLQLGLLGMYFCFLTFPKKQLRNAALVAMTILLVQSVPIRKADNDTMRGFSHIKSTWRSCYLKTEDIKHCDKVAGFWIYPWPEATHLQEKLQFLKQTKQNLYADTN